MLMSTIINYDELSNFTNKLQYILYACKLNATTKYKYAMKC